MKPYSQDLRVRIVEAYEAGEGSYRELAEQFHVHFNTVLNYFRLRRSTGTLRPRPHGGGVAPKIGPAEEVNLRMLVAEKSDRSQAEFARAYEQRGGVHVSRATMGRVMRRWGLTRKKKTCMRPKGTVRTSVASGPRL